MPKKPKKMSCKGCVYHNLVCCHYNRAIRCLTNNYALRKEEDDEETNSREASIWEMEGEDPG